jgi:cytochrome c oxidase subunit 4
MTRDEMREIWQLVRLPLLALIGLTVFLLATIAIAYVHLGPMNLVVALTIAAIKVAIIAVIFMELREASGVQLLAAGIGVFWLLFLFILSFSDYVSR